MVRNNSFVYCNIAGNSILVPYGHESAIHSGVVAINEIGLFIWNLLEKDCDLDEVANAICNEYDVSYEKALMDGESFVKQLREYGCIEGG